MSGSTARNQSPRVALVTGGAKGIGAAISARFARDGWHVVVADRDPAGSAPAGQRYAICDVGNEAAVAAVVRSIVATERRLDALVCNAGFMIRKPVAQLSLAEWSDVLTTNLTSTFLFVREAAALLRSAKGAVLTIASSRARMSEPNTESYSASKGGLVALTHALAISLGPDVRVNCISPGWILTTGPGAYGGRPCVSSGRTGRPAWRYRRIWRSSWRARTVRLSPALSSSLTAASRGR